MPSNRANGPRGEIRTVHQGCVEFDLAVGVWKGPATHQEITLILLASGQPVGNAAE